MDDDFLKKSREILDGHSQVQKILAEEDRMHKLLREHSVVAQIADEQKKHLTATDTIAKHIKEIEKQELGFLSASTIGSAIQAFQEEQKTWHKRIASEVITANSIGSTIAKYRESLDFPKSMLSLQAVHQESLASIQRAMTSMKSPWLDTLQTSRSIRGFAEIQAIGYALKSAPSFGAQITDALRVDLGDWRDSITWPEKIFTDPAARKDFYVERGFNTELTDFPAKAFHESLSIAGVTREPPGLVERYGPPVIVMRSNGEDEEAFGRTNAAHDWLQRLETQLRRFIDEVMTKAFGINWTKGRLPNGMYDRWMDKKRAFEKDGGKEWPLISYADFTDYQFVICRTDNWKEIFAPFFLRQESVKESFQRLHPIRLGTMHARPITQEDEFLLYVEAQRLAKACRYSG